MKYLLLLCVLLVVGCNPSGSEDSEVTFYVSWYNLEYPTVIMNEDLDEILAVIEVNDKDVEVTAPTNTVYIHWYTEWIPSTIIDGEHYFACDPKLLRE